MAREANNKAGKDLIQAAWRDLTGRGPGWLSRAAEGLSALKKVFPKLNTAALDL